MDFRKSYRNRKPRLLNSPSAQNSPSFSSAPRFHQDTIEEPQKNMAIFVRNPTTHFSIQKTKKILEIILRNKVGIWNDIPR